ncbi:tetratricopeptide repeat protein [Nodosilinea sp. LEGE 07298]|uniref:tetratricopeptide repeat protein n=1 Tax=Nodosilinea sp. LEGE 07298 TaxID=2777970 RepID=UPI00187EE79F|nr:tetratricopeptide repeat protein [Nodosilinea sp. LEGE 07298]MBE9111781.1 tetratricopeptide repeat protein [Nodosilinea sp. LEGE 07298]
MTTASREHHVECLSFLWQLIAQHQGDTTAVYQWLLAHPSKAQPHALAASLPGAASRWLMAHADPTTRPVALRVMATFANAMQQCALGDRAAQIELAIATYNWVLTELTTSSVDWATTLNNLATAYRHRQIGDPADNLEQAIKLYKQALAVHSPLTWPVTMTGLAAAYRDRIHGDPAENIDSAIATYEQVLVAIPQHRRPVVWAMVANHLASAYADRLWGDRLDNIDAAISTYRQGFVKLC